jgi:hypothetical protein
VGVGAGLAGVEVSGEIHSVRPSVRLRQRGARIEDIVIVTAGGVEPVNARPHELIVVPARPA